jgi:hypothetical protein
VGQASTAVIPASLITGVADGSRSTKQPMGFEVRETLESQPSKPFIVEERLEKCVCKTCQEGVVTAEGTPKPIEGGRLAILQTFVVLCELHDVSMLEYLRDVIAMRTSGWNMSRISDAPP